MRRAGVNKRFEESTMNFSGHCGSARDYYLGNKKFCRAEGKVVMSGDFHPRLWDFF